MADVCRLERLASCTRHIELQLWENGVAFCGGNIFGCPGLADLCSLGGYRLGFVSVLANKWQKLNYMDIYNRIDHIRSQSALGAAGALMDIMCDAVIGWMRT